MQRNIHVITSIHALLWPIYTHYYAIVYELDGFPSRIRWLLYAEEISVDSNITIMIHNFLANCFRYKYGVAIHMCK